MSNRLQKVSWAGHCEGATVEHMGIDHGGPYVAVAEELLDRADVLPLLQQVGGKGVPEGVAAGRLADTRCLHRPSYRFLHQGGIQVVTPFLLGPGISPAVVLRKEPLSAPFR